MVENKRVENQIKAFDIKIAEKVVEMLTPSLEGFTMNTKQIAEDIAKELPSAVTEKLKSVFFMKQIFNFSLEVLSFVAIILISLKVLEAFL